MVIRDGRSGTGTGASVKRRHFPAPLCVPNSDSCTSLAALTACPEAAGYRHRLASTTSEPRASAALSSPREVIPSFGNTRYKCVLIVRCER